MDLIGRLPTKYHKTAGQLFRFAISTGFSAACSVLIPILLHEALDVKEEVAVAVGFVTAYLGNMLLMRTFVFKSLNNWKQDISGYVVTNGAFRLAEYLAFLALLAWTNLTYIPALMLILSMSAVIKFHAYRWLFSR